MTLMKLKVLIAIIILGLVSVILVWYLNTDKQSSMNINQVSKTEGEITYIAIGDSYTIGNGVAEADRWPNVLVKHLNEGGINIRLIANPSVSGYTVADATRTELPVVKELQPDFVTVLIGANDNFRLKSPDVYNRELTAFLDELQSILKEPKNIVLVTIPDYSISPAASGNNTEGIAKSIQEYNEIVKAEGSKRGLPVADIFPVSQTMTGSDDYISDGLHPSAQGYAEWEKVIYPEVFELLKN